MVPLIRVLWYPTWPYAFLSPAVVSQTPRALMSALLAISTHQDVPDILIGSLVAAEADTGTEQALSSPHVAGQHLQLADPQGFAAVNLHLHIFLRVGFQDLLQQLILFILVKKARTCYVCGKLYHEPAVSEK